MKVIFLDVDGVLNSYEYFKRIENLNIEGIKGDVDVEKIKLLKKAIDETGAKVVLSSSWRYTKHGQSLKKLLLEYGIYADSTPFIQNERGIEIKQWLSDNQNVEDFVIVDDEIFKSYDEELLKKLIKIPGEDGCGSGKGLLSKDVDEIINRFGRIKNKEIKESSER